jgi:group I intron endonuclease
MIGIYKITNPQNKIYIGQSNSINKRKNNYASLNKYTMGLKIFNSIKKYGWENHTFEIIEECEESQLDEKEILYIKMYNCVLKGLNSTYGGKRFKHTDETKLKIGLSNSKPKPKTFIEKISKKRNFFPKGENHKHYGKIGNALGRKNSLKHINTIIDTNRGNTYRRKEVIQYDLNDNLIQTFKSAKEASIHVNGKSSQISLCCNNKIKTAYKYKWKYVVI